MLAALLLLISASRSAQSDGSRALPNMPEKELVDWESFVLADSADDCFAQLCARPTHCAVLFDSKMHNCHLVKMSRKMKFELVLQGKPANFKMEAPSVTTIVKIPIPMPVGLWPLDSVHKFRNLGRHGEEMDIFCVRNFQDFKWDGKGPPRSESGDQYLSYLWKWTKDTMIPGINDRPPECGFYLKQFGLKTGRPYLDMSKGFTIAFWLKTNTNKFIYSPMILFSFEGMTLRFMDGTDSLDLQVPTSDLRAYDHTTSVKNNTNLDAWRHIAVTSTGKHAPTFYLNARIWPQQTTQKSFKLVLPRAMFIATLTDAMLHGFRACFMMFQEVLSPAELNTVMNTCP